MNAPEHNVPISHRYPPPQFVRRRYLAAVLIAAAASGCTREIEPDLDQLTAGMVVGRSPSDPNMLDVAFPGDLRPNADLIEAQGNSGQLVGAVRIAQGRPIFGVRSANRVFGLPA